MTRDRKGMTVARARPLRHSIACRPKEMRVVSYLRWTLLAAAQRPVLRLIFLHLVRCLSPLLRKKTWRILDLEIAPARRNRLPRPTTDRRKRRSRSLPRNQQRRPPSQLLPPKQRPVEAPGFHGNGARRRNRQPQAQSKPVWEKRVRSTMTRN